MPPDMRADVGQSAAPEIVPHHRLPALEEEWAALWRRCPAADPFLAPAWLLSWARHFAPGRYAAVTFRAQGRLVAVAPVFCWDGALLLAGTGPSDRAGILLEPGWEGLAPQALSALPEAAPEPFDRIDLQQLPPGSPLLEAPCPPGWSEERQEGEACLVAPLEGTDGLGAASGGQRSHWRYALRRLERSGCRAGLVGPEDVPQAVEDLLRLNAMRWGAAGVLSDPLMAALLREAGPALAREGLLRLWEVRREGERIAALLALAGPWAHHFYNGGWDPAHGRLSPSMVLVGLAMRQAASEGVRHFDFLRGAEAYKALWGAVPHPMMRRILRPPRP